VRITKEQTNAFYVFLVASAGGNNQLTEWVKIRATRRAHTVQSVL
jgi:hypothetical protein